MSHFASTPHLVTAIVVGLIFFGGRSETTAAEFIPLGILPNAQESWAHAVSDNGQVVTGESGQIFRWTDATGLVRIDPLPGDNTTDLAGGRKLSPMSADGTVVVGHSRSQDNSVRAFIWRDGQGAQELDFEDLHDFGISANGDVIVGVLDEINGFKTSTIRWSLDDSAFSVVGTFPPIDNPAWPNGDFTIPAGVSSPDASYIVGTGSRIEARPNGEVWGPSRQFIWTADDGLQQLTLEGFSSDDTFGDQYEVERISKDGNVIAGRGVFLGDSELQAFRWTEETGAVGLGRLEDPADPTRRFDSEIRDMTDDGSLVIGMTLGMNPARGFIWSEQYGLEDLQDILADRFDLASELEGWSLAAPRDISPNGQFIVGTGLNPDGGTEGWLVRLDAPFLTVPEPTSNAFLICGGIGVVVRLRRRTRRVYK